MRELRVYRYRLILTEVDEGFMDPVADVLQRCCLPIIFEDLQLEHLKDALCEISKIMIDMLIAHFSF